MEILKEYDSLTICQQVEQMEVFTRYETHNKYRVLSPDSEDLFYAEEKSGNFFMMNFLHSKRPFVLDLTSIMDGSLFLRVDRPFRFIFQDATIYGGDGRELGSIAGQFKLLERNFHVLDSRKRKVYEISGPWFKPWTFHIKSGDAIVGKITKAWSGIMKEAFTQADNFGIEFPKHSTPELRAVLLGAVFLIDFAYFESKGGK